MFCKKAYALTLADPSNTHATKGHDEALGKGARSTIGIQGDENGFMNTHPVRINLPRRFGQGVVWTSLSPMRVNEANSALTRCDSASSGNVTGKTLAGLILMISDEEVTFRHKPVGYDSAILIKVIGVLE